MITARAHREQQTIRPISCVNLVWSDGLFILVTPVSGPSDALFPNLKRPRLTLSPENYALKGIPLNYRVTLLHFNWEKMHYEEMLSF